MNYEELVMDTDKMLHRIMVTEQIWMYVLTGLAVLMTVLAVAMSVMIWKERKLAKVQKVVGGYEFHPVVTTDVQVVNGVEFHRMGPASHL